MAYDVCVGLNVSMCRHRYLAFSETLLFLAVAMQEVAHRNDGHVADYAVYVSSMSVTCRT